MTPTNSARQVSKNNSPVYWLTATIVPMKQSRRNMKVRFIWSSQSSSERSLKMLKFLIVPREPSSNMFEHLPYKKVSYLTFKCSANQKSQICKGKLTGGIDNCIRSSDESLIPLDFASDLILRGALWILLFSLWTLLFEKFLPIFERNWYPPFNWLKCKFKYGIIEMLINSNS